MKVFLDTNFLISAFISRGFCHEVLRVIIDNHDLMSSEFVLNEFKRVALKKMNQPEELVRTALQFLKQYHVEPKPNHPSTVQVRDEDDRWVLQSAIQANADILITGDKDLLVIADKVQELKILSPRGFWELLKDQ